MTYPDKNDFYYFAVFDRTSRELLYTKYNFNFDLYKNDFELSFITKREIFYDFLIRNNTVYEIEFSVKEELIKYFFPITKQIVNYFEKYSYIFHPNTMIISHPLTYVSFNLLLENEFELVDYTDEQVVRIQDYIYIDKDSKYTKYNFIFYNYSLDFNVWGNHLTVFTDFIVRTLFINKVIIGAYGYGFPVEPFSKYFYQNDIELDDYLIQYSVTTNIDNVYKNINNINYKLYGELNPDLKVFEGNTELLKEHYLRYGQFERRIVPFYTYNNNTNIDNIQKSIVIVSGNNSNSSGFLYQSTNYDIINEVKQVYLVFCYHVIKDILNKNVIKVTIDYKETDRQVEFKIIGYDMYTDVCVAIYDATLNYNKIFNSDIETKYIQTLYLDLFEHVNISDDVFTIGNIKLIDNLSYLNGKVIDPKYSGVFSNPFMLSIPESLLLEIYGSKGFSGSPIFKGNVNEPSTVKCIGMIQLGIGDYLQYTVGIRSFTLGNIIENTILRWFLYSKLYANNISILNNLLYDAYPKKWLGTKNFYYHPTESYRKFPELSNFNYNGGIIIQDFIIGFNFEDRYFIYDAIDLKKYTSVRLDTPLLKSRMYNRYIYSSRRPIILKSITFFESINSMYKKYDLGKFKNQYSYDIITYGLGQLATYQNNNKYSNPILREYPILEFEYFYYNGLEWILETEKIGGNTKEWYNTYTNSSGDIFYQHKFEYPNILLTYTPIYSYYLLDDTTDCFPHNETRDFKNVLSLKSSDQFKIISKSELNPLHK